MIHWTKKEMDYVIENYGKIPIEEISIKIKRSPTAIRTFLHRNKISIGGKKVKHNMIQSVLEKKIGNSKYFSPTRKFFESVRIGQRRWWDLYYGRK